MNKSILAGVLLVAPMLAQSKLEQFYEPVSSASSHKIVYRVREGDTLFSIAQRILGDPYHARLLQEVNGISDPLSVAPGRSIQVPVPALGILYSLEKVDNCDLVSVNEQQSFRPGDRFKLRLSANIEGYAYLFNRRPDGAFVRLSGAEPGVKVKPFAEYVLPRGEEWFRFDEDRGTDELILLVSPRRLTELDSDLTAETARERIRELVAANSGRRSSIGEGREGQVLSLVVPSEVGESMVLAHRIVLRKR